MNITRVPAEATVGGDHSPAAPLDQAELHASVAWQHRNARAATWCCLCRDCWLGEGFSCRCAQCWANRFLNVADTKHSAGGYCRHPDCYDASRPNPESHAGRVYDCPADREPPPEPDVPGRSPWWIDLAGVDTAALRPALVTREDGRTLFYADAAHVVAGLWGCGKSWAGYCTAAATLANGHRAIYVDFEDGPRTAVERLTLLGARDDALDADRFRYVSGGRLWFDYGNGDHAERLDLEDAIRWLDGGLVVFDTMTSAGAPTDGRSVHEWLSLYIAPFRATACATLSLGHLPKRTADRPPGPIGSQELASAPDVAYRLAGTAWGKAPHNGLIHLAVEKDRHGDVPAKRNEIAATVIGNWRGEAFAWRFAQPTTKNADADTPRSRLLTALADRQTEGILGVRAAREAAGGNRAKADQALQELIDAGLADEIPHGRGRLYLITNEGLAEHDKKETQ